jgi:hypothetical protein
MHRFPARKPFAFSQAGVCCSPSHNFAVGELSMSDPRLAAANRIIAEQCHVLAKAHAALKQISRNAAIADEWLVPIYAAIAEIEGRASRDGGARVPAHTENRHENAHRERLALSIKIDLHPKSDGHPGAVNSEAAPNQCHSRRFPMSSDITRRLIVAGAASLSIAGSVASAAPSALASPAVGGPDPIFAAIEAHREAFMRKMKAGRVSIACSDTPEEEAAWAVEDAARDVLSDAAFDLTEIQPTTLAGVLALLAYVDDFHVQALVLPEEPEEWHSHHKELGWLDSDTIRDRFNGKPIELPYNFWIMRNVRAALQVMAIPS